MSDDQKSSPLFQNFGRFAMELSVNRRDDEDLLYLGPHEWFHLIPASFTEICSQFPRFINLDVRRLRDGLRAEKRLTSEKQKNALRLKNGKTPYEKTKNLSGPMDN